MADTRLTEIRLCRKAYLCLLALFFPDELVKEEKEDNEKRKNFPQPPPPQEHSAFTIRRAFWSSFFLVITFGIIGYVIGYLWDLLTGCVNLFTITVLQIIGALVLLWGTLFVRGWEIQTIGGVELTERVNKWLFRSMYCFGTGIIVCSLALSSCPK